MNRAHELKLLAEASESGRISAQAKLDRLQSDFDALARQLAASQAEVARVREAHEQICTNYNNVSFASEERGNKLAARDKQLSDAVGLLRKGKAHCQGFSELWEKEVDAFLTTIEQDKENG